MLHIFYTMQLYHRTSPQTFLLVTELKMPANSKGCSCTSTSTSPYILHTKPQNEPGTLRSDCNLNPLKHGMYLFGQSPIYSMAQFDQGQPVVHQGSEPVAPPLSHGAGLGSAWIPCNASRLAQALLLHLCMHPRVRHLWGRGNKHEWKAGKPGFRKPDSEEWPPITRE